MVSWYVAHLIKMTVLIELQGPAQNRPLQIDLGDDDVEDEGNVIKVNNNEDKGRRPQRLQRS